MGRESSRPWGRLRAAALRRDRWRCRQCGRAGALEADHVRPVADGGARWALSNVQMLCRGCHIRKTRRENEARAGRRALPHGKADWGALVSAALDAAPGAAAPHRNLRPERSPSAPSAGRAPRIPPDVV